MKKSSLATIFLLLAGGAALFALQQKNATTEITPRPLLHLVADAQREVERIPLWLTRVSAEEEARIGQEIAQKIQAEAGDDAREIRRLAAYLARVGAPVAAAAERRAIQYRFHLINHKGFLNAFAVPGGHVFVGRGMLEMFETEDALASVLGHEVAHIDRRHAIERLQYELKARKLGLGAFYRLGSLPILLFQQGYSKEQELEADRVGLSLAVEAGYSPAGALAVMRKLAELQPQADKQADSPLQEAAAIPLQSLREYFRSHPPPHDRIAELEKEIKSRGWDPEQTQSPLALPAAGETAEDR